MPLSDLERAALAAAQDGAYPDGRPGRFLAASAVAALAATHGRPGWEVERAAARAGVCPLRYARNLHAFSLEEQGRLLGATVAQVGLGGLGGWLLENFARMGVGRLRGADGDVFEETNCNRQMLADTASLGRGKAEQVARRAASLNPSMAFTARQGFLDGPAMREFLDGADVAVDALGGLADRPALAEAAAARGIPLVSAAVAGYTVIVATVLPGAASPMSLLAGDGKGPSAELTLGCPCPAVMAAAALQASETLRLLAGRPPALAGKAMLFDLETMRCDTIAFG